MLAKKNVTLRVTLFSDSVLTAFVIFYASPNAFVMSNVARISE